MYITCIYTHVRYIYIYILYSLLSLSFTHSHLILSLILSLSPFPCDLRPSLGIFGCITWRALQWPRMTRPVGSWGSNSVFGGRFYACGHGSKSCPPNFIKFPNMDRIVELSGCTRLAMIDRCPMAPIYMGWPYRGTPCSPDKPKWNSTMQRPKPRLCPWPSRLATVTHSCTNVCLGTGATALCATKVASRGSTIADYCWDCYTYH